MRGKAAKRLLLALGLGFVMTPVALGVGVVLLVAAFDDDEASAGNPVGGLRIGKGGVPAEYAPAAAGAERRNR
ncbi:hypothetical protein [Streptomyces cyslabdanicus]|uniref:hypothetical protein n=1 Tax=Streptomyces cyslabdanicus TaxID=1470456 RepID=UPI00404414BF